MKYRFMEDHRSRFTVAEMASHLGVNVSGYYSWLNRIPSSRAVKRAELEDRVKKIFFESHETYGSPRVYCELTRDGEECSLNTVAYIMRKLGLVAKAGRKFKVTTDSDHPYPPSPNLLAQQFNAASPDEKWLSDITYIRTDEGWLYLCVILDVFSRKVVGWSMMDRISRDLLISAFHMAYNSRKPKEGFIFHSDRGSQYASMEFRKLLKVRGIHQSMSGKGNCYDNFPAESFFKTLKTEEVYWHKYRTKAEAKINLFRYIEGFYNTRRIHSSLGYRSPKEFEMIYKMDKLRGAA
ncbi:MAG: IS3 family transposase [bacterium]|jgi:transposase InsO family protein|nr:IS3 family transposase [bacterium]